MHPVEETISCQVSFIPVGVGDPDVAIKEVVDRIERSNLKCRVGVMSTVIQGQADLIFDLLKDIVSANLTRGFIMDVRFSNVCGSL